MNKKGFIATSLIYSFFLVFITLFLTIIADYLQDKVLLNTIEDGIKEELNNGMSASDFKSGYRVVFQGNDNSFEGIEQDNCDDIFNNNGSKLYTVDTSTENAITFENGCTVRTNGKKLIKLPSDGQVITIVGVKGD